jgi:hypothetical protein
MHKRRRRAAAAVRGGGPVDLVRAAAGADLARVVPRLRPEALHQLIRSRGLDACDEIVAGATPAQLTSLLDIDLWRHGQAGGDDQFDSMRFVEWLEALAEMEDAVAARVLAGLDPGLVVTGLSRFIRVFDCAAVVQVPWDDESSGGCVLDSESITREIGGYVVCARETAGWDAIVSLLDALETDYHDAFHTIMRGCREVSNSTPEVDGLDDLLLAPEQLLYDVTVDRVRRRSQRGYVACADARAFLQMATRADRGVFTASLNPIVAGHLKYADDDRMAPDNASLGEDGAQPLVDDARSIREDARAAARHLLSGPAASTPPLTHLRSALERLADRNHAAHLERLRELAFLANVLTAGCSVQSRAFTPKEASEAAASICNLGIERAAETESDFITAFGCGWRLLHEEVSLFVAGQIMVALDDLHSLDADIQNGLDRLRDALEKACEADAPWRARDALDVIAILDPPAWVGLTGLLDECPVLPEALTAILERRAGRFDANAFTFFSTYEQVRQVRGFMRNLLDVLV